MDKKTGKAIPPKRPVVAGKAVGGKGTAPAEVVKKAIKKPAFRVESAQHKAMFLKLLIYGTYGVGKTTLAGSALLVPSMGDVIMLSIEGGEMDLEGDENLDVVEIGSFKQFGAVHSYLQKHCIAREANDIEALIAGEAEAKGETEDEVRERGPRKYRTVIIDSATEVEAYSFNQLLGVSWDTRIDLETDGAEWPEYKKNLAMMLRLIRQFRDLKMHVIITAGEKYIQDETKKFKYLPDLTGQLSKKCQGYFDMVGYYTMTVQGDEQVRKLHVIPSAKGKFDAKHRYRNFKGTEFVNPTIGGILKEVGLADRIGVPLK